MIEYQARRTSSTDWRERNGVRDRVQVRCVVEARRSNGSTYPHIVHIVETWDAAMAFFLMERDVEAMVASHLVLRDTDFYRVGRHNR